MNSRLSRMSSGRSFGSGLSITSVIRPGRGLITTILVDRYTASGIEWVTKADGLARPRPEVQKLLVQPVPHDLVERAKGFVHQEDIGIEGQRAGDRRPLLHPPRQLPGELVAEPLELHELQRLATRSACSAFEYPMISSGSRTLSPIVRHG
jgi:hypothetical protein